MHRDVRDYGAKAHSSVDDTLAIQAAINDMTPEPLFFPPGTYHVSDTLDIPHKGIRLLGAGRTDAQGDRVTTIKLTANTVDMLHVLSSDTAHGNITIENVLFEGVGANSGHGFVSAQASGRYGLRVLHCEFKGFGGTDKFGVSVSKVYQLVLDQCLVRDCYSGIECGSEAISAALIDCWVNNYTKYGVKVVAGPVQITRGLITGCDVPRPTTQLGLDVGANAMVMLDSVLFEDNYKPYAVAAGARFRDHGCILNSHDVDCTIADEADAVIQPMSSGAIVEVGNWSHWEGMLGRADPPEVIPELFSTRYVLDAAADVMEVDTDTLGDIDLAGLSGDAQKRANHPLLLKFLDNHVTVNHNRSAPGRFRLANGRPWRARTGDSLLVRKAEYISATESIMQEVARHECEPYISTEADISLDDADGGRTFLVPSVATSMVVFTLPNAIDTLGGIEYTFVCQSTSGMKIATYDSDDMLLPGGAGGQDASCANICTMRVRCMSRKRWAIVDSYGTFVFA